MTMVSMVAQSSAAVSGVSRAVTAMRRGEIAGLPWHAVDVNAARLQLATTINDAGASFVITDTPQ